MGYALSPLMSGACYPEKFSDFLYGSFYETRTGLAQTSDTLQMKSLFDFDDRIKALDFNKHYYLIALLIMRLANKE